MSANKNRTVESEIYEIPYRARLCFEKNKGLILPEKVPYIGMGSSFFAAEVIKYLGFPIFPELASEYCIEYRQDADFENAVIISQSGESVETLACAKKFQAFTGIVNSEESKLCKLKNVRQICYLNAGPEFHSSSKTYLNTLVVLYLGLGLDPTFALESIHNRFNYFKELGENIAVFLLKKMRKKRFAGLYIIGNGPNIGTVHQAAQILTETTKLPFIGLPASQYNHGLKEAASNSIVIVLNPSGRLYDRTRGLIKTIEKAGASVYQINEDELMEELSPFSLILPFFFTAMYLVDKMRISDDFIVGDKIIAE